MLKTYVCSTTENIKPREQQQQQSRGNNNNSAPLNERERSGRDYDRKGNNGAAGKGDLKREGKRKSEVKKTGHDKTTEAGKQVGLQLTIIFIID